ncbi:Fructose dehydrogenase large subunit [compost metagenome]|uniref:Choline dehydrogenase n=1 Tax=Pseudomonas jinjuensis TaxID=198616 RepID=A0A1H0BF63_9PSED|nr:GMC family oxidoreductase [Pseudomonas jinjuensis]SDN44252.1 Choline dehydrogenase [Pseudomonas jinjuensis]
MPATQRADYVVVGSGVAGALVAHRLALAGRDVLILEAGPRLARWQLVERFRNLPDKFLNPSPYPSAAHAPHPQYQPDNHYLVQAGEQPCNAQYIRAVGGTTWNWLGAAWRFLPADFRLRTLYGVGRDWPLDYAELEPWYQRAEEELGVWGPADEELGSPRSAPYPMQPLPLSWNEQRVRDLLNGNGYRMVTEPAARNSRPYDERPTCCGNNNCMPVCPIGAMYGGIVHVHKAERAGARIIENAVVHRLEKGGKNRIVAALYKDPQGAEVRVEGKVFVLAANAIETPKLMLMSGVGNSSDMLGRNLMTHPGTALRLQAREKLWPGRGPQAMTALADFRDGDFRRERGAKKLQLSNLSRIDQATAELIRSGPLLLGRDLEARIRDRAARFVQFDSLHETLPRPENRIVPSASQRDDLGLPRPEITWAPDDYLRQSAAHTREVYADIARLLGGSDVQFSDDFNDGGDIAGTALMGDDPRDAVVDGDCRSYDHPNLFLAGGAVLPSIGSVNCTLTIAALALRLAGLLQRET